MDIGRFIRLKRMKGLLMCSESLKLLAQGAAAPDGIVTDLSIVSKNFVLGNVTEAVFFEPRRK